MNLAEELGGVRALRGLGEPHLHQLAALAQPRECPQGGVLFREGDDSPFLFVLLSGEVALEVKAGDRGPAAIYAAGPGELLGWSPVLGRHAMTATARAAAPCRLVVLDVGRVAELVRQDPHFGVAFLRQIGLVVSDRLALRDPPVPPARVVVQGRVEAGLLGDLGHVPQLLAAGPFDGLRERLLRFAGRHGRLVDLPGDGVRLRQLPAGGRTVGERLAHLQGGACPVIRDA